MPVSNELSERELEILILVAKGASNKEVAQELFISTNTVKVHLRNIFTKIEVNSRTEAALYAVNNGLLQGVPPQVDEQSGSLPAGNGNVGDGISYPAGETSNRGAETRYQKISPRAALVLVVFLTIGALGLGFAFLRQSDGRGLASTPDLTGSNRWQILAPMPTARLGLALAAYENQIFAIAGETADGVTGVVERYDAASNTWESLAPKPNAAGDVSAALIAGKIYVPGGRLSSGAVSDLVEIYDPRQDAWTEGARLPLALSAYALVAYEGKLYLFGGWDGEKYLDSVFEYDPEPDRWAAKATMPTARGYSGAAVVGGKIYVMGGFDGQRPLATNEIYSPDLDNGVDHAWSKGSPMPAGRYRMGVSSIADIIQIVGGLGARNQPLVSLEYLPQSNSWQELGSLDQQIWSDLSAVPLGTHLFIVGGRLDGLPTSRNLSYQAIYTIHMPIVR